MPTYYALLLTAVLMIALELFTSLRNQKTFFDGTGGAVWTRIYRWRWLAGVPFAVLSAFLHYSASTTSGRCRRDSLRETEPAAERPAA